MLTEEQFTEIHEYLRAEGDSCDLVNGKAHKPEGSRGSWLGFISNEEAHKPNCLLRAINVYLRIAKKGIRITRFRATFAFFRRKPDDDPTGIHAVLLPEPSTGGASETPTAELTDAEVKVYREWLWAEAIGWFPQGERLASRARIKKEEVNGLLHDATVCVIGSSTAKRGEVRTPSAYFSVALRHLFTDRRRNRCESVPHEAVRYAMNESQRYDAKNELEAIQSRATPLQWSAVERLNETLTLTNAAPLSSAERGLLCRLRKRLLKFSSGDCIG